jgi:hypothetical protein
MRGSIPESGKMEIKVKSIEINVSGDEVERDRLVRRPFKLVRTENVQVSRNTGLPKGQQLNGRCPR